MVTVVAAVAIIIAIVIDIVLVIIVAAIDDIVVLSIAIHSTSYYHKHDRRTVTVPRFGRQALCKLGGFL